MTPKSLLRHKLAVSPPAERPGQRPFQVRHPRDRRRSPPERGQARRALHRQGLLRPAGKRGASKGAKDVAIVRRRAALPLPGEQPEDGAGALPRTPRWCGARRSPRTWAPGPSSTGGWRRSEGLDIKAKRPDYVGREQAASPATGLAKVHAANRELVGAAIGAGGRTLITAHRARAGDRRHDGDEMSACPRPGRELITATVGALAEAGRRGRRRRTSRWSSWRPTRSPPRSMRRPPACSKISVGRGRRGRVGAVLGGIDRRHRRGRRRRSGRARRQAGAAWPPRRASRRSNAAHPAAPSRCPAMRRCPPRPS